MCDFIEETAAQLLSAGAFKLWRYCVRHKDNEDKDSRKRNEERSIL